MTDPADFDWSKSENFERRLLSEAFAGLFRASRSARKVIELALKESVSDSFVDNVQRGIGGRRHAQKLFEYLSAHDPEAAQALMRKLQPRAESPWAKFYKKKRIDDRLALALHVDHASPLFRDPPGITQLFNDDLFYLQLDSDIDGHAIGLSADRRHWYGLGVGPTPVTKGRQWITRDDRRDDDLTKFIFGGPVGTDAVRPIQYKGKSRYPELVVIVADEKTTSQLMNSGHIVDVAIDGRALDRMLAILETSKGPWFVAWVSPSFVPPDSLFKRSE